MSRKNKQQEHIYNMVGAEHVHGIQLTDWVMPLAAHEWLVLFGWFHDQCSKHELKHETTLTTTGIDPDTTI